MKMIFLYGPPAVGKLTVAKSIELKTGIKIYHNHLSHDYASKILQFGTKEFGEFVKDLRYMTIEYMASKSMDFIFTFCYAYPNDDKFIDEIINIIEKHRGEICFVQLLCSIDKMEERIENESRKDHGKLREKNNVKQVLNKWDLFTPIKNSYCIDNTNISADTVADMIIDKYNIRRAQQAGGANS